MKTIKFTPAAFEKWAKQMKEIDKVFETLSDFESGVREIKISTNDCNKNTFEKTFGFCEIYQHNVIQEESPEQIILCFEKWNKNLQDFLDWAMETYAEEEPEKCFTEIKNSCYQLSDNYINWILYSNGFLCVDVLQESPVDAFVSGYALTMILM